jgi:hypothetical protein
MKAMIEAKNTAHTDFGCVSNDGCTSGFEVDATECGVDDIHNSPF